MGEGRGLSVTISRANHNSQVINGIRSLHLSHCLGVPNFGTVQCYDAGKKIHGRKRHLSVDLLGLVLRVLVTSASLPEREGAKKVLNQVHNTGNQVKRLNIIWMDGGYRGEEFMRWVMDMFRWIVTIVLRPLEKKGFVHLPKRWVVERTFGWLNWCRRLSKDYERLPETSETFIYVAMIRIMVRRLA